MTTIYRGRYWATLIFVLLVLCSAIVLLAGCSKTNRNSAMVEYDNRIKKLTTTDPSKLAYTETEAYRIDLSRTEGIAVGPKDSIYVAGDRSIVKYTPNGMRKTSILLEQAPYAVDISYDGNIVIAMQDHVRILRPQGVTEAVFKSRGDSARFTSVSCSRSGIFVGDAGRKEILHYDYDGNLLNTFAKGTLVVPSRHLDVYAVDNVGVWVVNPGRHTVSLYKTDGTSSRSWGSGGGNIEGFSGCCNPTDITLTADGRFVTSEKGIPRVKIYDQQGKFSAVVAPPESFDSDTDSLDIAVDNKQRILVLDKKRNQVRVYEPRSKQ